MLFEIVNPAIKRDLEIKRSALTDRKARLESDIRKRSDRLSVIHRIICSGDDAYLTSGLLFEEDSLSFDNDAARSILKGIESKITQLNDSVKFVDRTLASRPLVAV